MSTKAAALTIPVTRQAVQAAAHALLAVLLGLALVMFTRRIGGAFVQPLPGLTLVVVAIALGLTAAVVRLPAVPRAGHLLFALPGLAVILILAALTLAGTPAAAIAVAWFVVIASEAASWLAPYHSKIERRPLPRSIANRAEVGAVAECEPELPTGLIQQLTRVREEDRESLHAILLAEIPANDRQAALHIAFCPPLDAAPELTAHALDADDADVRITQAESFGARIEVRLPAVSAEPRTILVEVLGSATCS